MFTGIVAAMGRIVSVEPLQPAGGAAGVAVGVRLRIDAGGLDLSDVVIGDSISIQGACMTAVSVSPGGFEVEVSQESLRLTAGLSEPGDVNLEKALRLADRLGGHLVSGHVDGLGRVSRFEPVGESWLLAVTAPAELGKYLAYKGSITVNGVSLTVNTVTDGPEGCRFSVNLIPHTISVTTLRHLKVGSAVNLEIDMIARYVERMMQGGARQDARGGASEDATEDAAEDAAAAGVPGAR